MAAINPPLLAGVPFQPMEPVELGNLLAPDPNSLSARVSRVASTALRYATFTTICVGSTCFFDPNTTTILSLGLIAAASYYTVCSIRSVAGQAIPVEDIKVKAEKIARVAFWSLLIGTPLLTGLAGRYLFDGSDFLLYGIRTAKALQALQAISNVTLALGYLIPLVKFLLKFSNNLHENYNSLVRRLESTIQSFQGPLAGLPPRFIDALDTILARLNLSNPNGFDFDTIIETGESLDETFLRAQFKNNLRNLSNKRISEVITKFPNTFTIDFLAECLSKTQFDAVVKPKLTPPSSEELERIDEGINRLEERLNNLETRKKQGEDHAILLKEAETLFEIISGYAREVRPFLARIRNLPEQDLSQIYPNLQDEINTFKALEPQIKTLYEKLTGEEKEDLSSRLRHFSSSVSLQDNSLATEEPSYFILGGYGFQEPHFKTLGLRLGLSEEDLKNHEIQKTYEHLSEHGLSNHYELIEHHILDVPKKGQHLTIQEISDRIVAFCTNGEIQAAPPSQVEGAPQSQAIASQPRWAFVANTANTLFHIMFSGGLIAFQISQQPISTLAGFGFRLWRDDLNPIGIGATALNQLLQHFYQSPPSYIHQGFTELMQELFKRTSAILLSIDLSFIGGVVSGFHQANALFNYSQSMQNPFRRWRVARA